MDIKEQLLLLLNELGGHYLQPTAKDPLVGYAGTYEVDGQRKNFVGREYFDCAVLEEDPAQLLNLCYECADELVTLEVDQIFMPAPMGGLAFGTILAACMDRECYYPEKKVLEIGVAGSRDKEELIFSRHQLPPGRGVVIVEDVVNNFSTTAKMKALIESVGSEMSGILCLVNRSGQQEWEGLPVYAVAKVDAQQWKQEDDEVRELIEAGNVVWKAKAARRRLQDIMARAQSAR